MLNEIFANFREKENASLEEITYEQGKEDTYENVDLQKAINPQILQNMMEHPVQGRSVEFNDNRISLYVAQRGRCGITHEPLEPHQMDVHHIIPVEQGGKDNYSNLIIVTTEAHRLIHATHPKTIEKYCNALSKSDVNWIRLNKLRLLAGNCKIEVNR